MSATEWMKRFAPSAELVRGERIEVRLQSVAELRRVLPFESQVKSGERRVVDLGEFVVSHKG